MNCIRSFSRRSLSWLALALAATLPAAAATFTSNTSIDFFDLTYDGQDIVVSNGVLTVDGAHNFGNVRVASGAGLTHSQIAAGSFDVTGQAVDEPHLLTDTNAVWLANSNVVFDSVVVRGLPAMIVYSNGVDYLLTTSNEFTLLQRTDTSAIPSGDTVVVSYDYVAATVSGGFRLNLSGNFEVEPGATVDVRGRGYGGNLGPGNGGEFGSPTSGGGAGHGGYGGLSLSNAPGGNCYGVIDQPQTLGSGGGAGTSGVGGAGGGSAVISAAGDIVLNGSILADGFNATNSRSGGGAGGSVWLTAGTIRGTGSVTAHGGTGEPIYGGGGGGGRIAIDCSANLFTGTLAAHGGLGAKIGGAGTVFTRVAGTSLLLVENGGLAGTNSAIAITNAANVLIRSNAVVRPSGAWVVGDITVEAGGAISADSGGSFPGSGTGAGLANNTDVRRPGSGGGHGGYGGAAVTNALGGTAHSQSSVHQPTTFGGAGGNYLPTSPGGAGGGAIQITAAGTVRVDGRISADGGNGSGIGGGGGAGGSIYLSVGTLTGSGRISANGGNGASTVGGGGGGGRIAIYLGQSNQLSGPITAYGGSGANWGGAGTIYTRVNLGHPLLVVDNGDRIGTNTLTAFGNLAGPDVLVRGNGILVPTDSLVAGYITVASNSAIAVSGPNSTLMITASQLTVATNAGLIADGAGGTAVGVQYAGGGHGGYGGASGTNTFGGSSTTGSQTQPVSFGASGGYGSSSSTTTPGGPGGGAIRLNVTGDLTIHGRVSADGRNSVQPTLGAGGGAGGSIWITTGRVLGTGTITANGGAGSGTVGGGGGGGRIAIYSSGTNALTGSVSAFGGTGANRGGAGTIYTETPILQVALLRQLTLDNGGYFGTNTPVTSLPAATLVVRNGAIATLVTSSTFASLLVQSNGAVTLPGSSGPQLQVTSATLEPGGAIHADGLGTGGNGVGGSVFVSSGVYYGGGGGHGGFGGNGGSTNARGGFAYTYNSPSQPTYPGSAGGGSGSTFSPFGGTGGGVVRLNVSGTLTNNGRISADGKVGSGNYAGGGSGGSVWLSVGTLTGSGIISANGGPGIWPGGGGGGGGRVAVYFNSTSYRGGIAAYGGSGTNYGGAGTVYLKTNSAPYGQIYVDNGGNVGSNTTFTLTSTTDLIVANRGIAALPPGSTTLHSLEVRTNGLLLGTNSLSSPPTLSASGQVIVAAGGRFLCDGLGYSPGAGTLNGAGTAPRGGAGHGGFGGYNGSGGNAYGSVTPFVGSPLTLGSGGGGSSGNGGAGGGALQLQITGALRVDGILSANGRDATYGVEGGGGGGAGGCLRLVCANLLGTGTISANGGNGVGVPCGGGGGGRISIQFGTNSFAGTILAAGGTGTVGGGAGTVYLQRSGANSSALLLDNAGILGTNTPLSSAMALPSVPFDLRIANGATLFPVTPLPVLSNLTVAAGGVLTMRTNDTNLLLYVLRDVNVLPGGALTVAGKGFGRGASPGAGGSIAAKGAGGGYGGRGGNSSSGASGGTNYGSATRPVDRGSGGGAGANTYFGGSEGGGAIRLSVAGTLNVEGTVSANGNPGWQDDSGGGAGGSLWITASNLTGSGVISASGGDGDLFGGGGGGGGRLAIYSPANTFTGLVSVVGGSGASAGEPGTLFVSTNLPDFEAVSSTPSGVVGSIVSSVVVTFSDLVYQPSVSGADFKLYLPDNSLAPSAITTSYPTTSSVRFSFDPLTTSGDYRFETGPDISDFFGRSMSLVSTGRFTVAIPTISGTITNAAGLPVAGVVMQPSSGAYPTVTDTNGNYTLGVPVDWSGTVTPNLETFLFAPEALNYTNVLESLTNQNYLLVGNLAATLTPKVSGTNFSLGWTGLSNATYQIETSTNLVDWLPLGDALSGTNGWMELLVPVNLQPAEFLRVRTIH